MLSKLILNNIKRNIYTYSIYFLTMTLTMSLIYAFSVIVFNYNIISIEKDSNMLKSGILLISVFVVFVSVFMIDYTLQFSLMYRQKEFGIYNLLGMEKRSICNIFLVENLILAAMVFIFGILLGGFISKIFVWCIIRLLNKQVAIEYSCFSVKSIGMTLGLQILMYIGGLNKSIKKIKRQNIIDLIYESKKNEIICYMDKRNIILRLVIFLVVTIMGISLLIKAIFFTSTNIAFMCILIGIIFTFIGMYKVYCIIPKMYTVSKKKDWMYKGSNIFLYGQIRAKVSSIGRVLGISAMLSTAALITIFLGLSMARGYRANIHAEYPYDVAIGFDAKIKDFKEVIDYVDKITPIKESVTFYLYETPKYEISILALSDYNRLRKQVGLKEKELGEFQYIIHCDSWKIVDIISEKIEINPSIILNGSTLEGSRERIYTEPLEQYRIAGSNGYVMVVPDNMVEYLETHQSRLVISLKEGSTTELQNELEEFIYTKWHPELLEEVTQNVTTSVAVKAWGIEHSLTGFITLAFCSLYLNIIFVIFSGALLSFKHVSNIRISQLNYRNIRLLGIENNEVNSIIFKEVAFVFLIPIVIPVILTILIGIILNYSVGNVILERNVFLICLCITLIIFSCIYITYFFLTYIIYSRSLNELDSLGGDYI